MRADRLVSLLLLLQNRGRMTAPELAERLEVSVRTVYRDVEALSAAGIPVYADRGPAGGYRLLGGYRTRLTGLTGDEAVALLFSGMPGPADELGLGTVLAGAELKLLAALPAEPAERAGRIRQRFHLDVPHWFGERDETPWLAVIADAVWDGHRVDADYRRTWRPDPDRPVARRRLDPLGLVLKAGAWYLVAGNGGELRTYRVSRFTSVTPLDESANRPDGFDLAGFWQDRDRRLRAGQYTAEAVVRLDPTARRMMFLLGPVVRRRVEETAGEPDADGRVEARVPIESVRHAVHELLRLGAGVEVLEPAELRAAIAGHAAAMAARYAASPLA